MWAHWSCGGLAILLAGCSRTGGCELWKPQRVRSTDAALWNRARWYFRALVECVHTDRRPRCLHLAWMHGGGGTHMQQLDRRHSVYHAQIRPVCRRLGAMAMHASRWHGICTRAWWCQLRWASDQDRSEWLTESVCRFSVSLPPLEVYGT